MSSVIAPLQYYSEAQTAKMVGISVPRLRAWCRAGIASNAHGTDSLDGYTFQDLVALRSTKAMVERGVSLASIRAGLARLSQDAPGEVPAHCLARHRVVADSGRWSVQRQGRTVDVHSGQLSFNYDSEFLKVQEEHAEVLSLPRSRRHSHLVVRGPVEPQGEYCADTWFEHGADCELLWDQASPTDVYFRKAQQAYLKAVELDEEHARAWTNLGTLHAIVGEPGVARKYYEVAHACDEAMVEPSCNLGELDLREGKFQDAAERFGSILAAEPEHLDALYGLARAMIALGEHEWGADVLRIYCGCLSKMDPQEIDDELQERWEGARMVLSTYQNGYTKSSGRSRPGLELA